MGDILKGIEFLNIPTTISFSLIGLFLILQIVGELLEFKGKVVPEFLKIRKYFDRKKKERQAFSQMSVLLDEYNQMSSTLTEVQRLLTDIDQHYSNDNIKKRDNWMKEVNKHMADNEKKQKEQDALMRELSKKLDKNNEDTLALLIDSKRNKIIDFASDVINENYPVTREQFKRIFKLYEEYEDIIEKNGLTNGEVDIAYRIIKESYEKHMRSHSFIEDVRGYS